MPSRMICIPSLGISAPPQTVSQAWPSGRLVVFGLVAGAIGVTVFMADPDADPMHAMALAPTEIINARPTRSPCSDDISERVGSDCAPRAHKSARSAGPQ